MKCVHVVLKMNRTFKHTRRVWELREWELNNNLPTARSKILNNVRPSENYPTSPENLQTQGFTEIIEQRYQLKLRVLKISYRTLNLYRLKKKTSIIVTKQYQTWYQKEKTQKSSRNLTKRHSLRRLTAFSVTFDQVSTREAFSSSHHRQYVFRTKPSGACFLSKLG